MKLAGCVLSVFLLLATWSFAQDSDQPSSDGVLVSPPNHDGQGVEPEGGGHLDRYKDRADGDGFLQDGPQHAGNRAVALNSTTDEIILKSTDAIMKQITENMKLTQEQISAIRAIVEDNVVQTRVLQLSLQKGSIDSKTMYSQREQLDKEEDQKLSRILTSDQMRVWLNIQNP